MTDSMQQMALDTLSAYFGYTSFSPCRTAWWMRFLQAAMRWCMPTGADKSIYQVPALMLPGITFVGRRSAAVTA